jgi:hypothetical protein
MAVADAVSKIPDCDQLINPIFSTITENNTITAEVTGYPARLKDMRPVQIGDTALFTAIYKAETRAASANATSRVTLQSSVEKRDTIVKEESSPQSSTPGHTYLQGNFGNFSYSILPSRMLGGWFSSKFGLTKNVNAGFSIGYFSTKYNESVPGFNFITNSYKYTAVPIALLLEGNVFQKGPLGLCLGVDLSSYIFTKTLDSSKSQMTRNIKVGLAPYVGVNFFLTEKAYLNLMWKYHMIEDSNHARSLGIGLGVKF